MQNTGAEKPKPPLRYQLYALGGIVLFAALLGALTYGVKAAGTSLYVQPVCEKTCAGVGAQYADVEYHEGKRDHESLCVCTNGARIHVGEADTMATLSAFSAITLSLGGTGLFIVVLAHRARRKKKTR